MRKVKITRNLGQGLPDYKEGEVVSVNNAEAENLIKKGLAVDAAEAEKAEAKSATRLEAVPPAVDVRGTDPAEIRKLKRDELDALAAEHDISLEGMNVEDSREYLVSELCE